MRWHPKYIEPTRAEAPEGAFPPVFLNIATACLHAISQGRVQLAQQLAGLAAHEQRRVILLGGGGVTNEG